MNSFFLQFHTENAFFQDGFSVARPAAPICSGSAKNESSGGMPDQENTGATGRVQYSLALSQTLVGQRVVQHQTRYETAA